MVQTRSDAQANRKRLLDAALVVLSERGMNAEMKEIAERAGVGVGTIYRNFATKDDLLGAVLGEVVCGFRDATTAALEEPDAIQAIRTYFTLIVETIDRFGNLARAMMSGDVPACAGEHFVQLMSDTRMRQVFERGKADGVFRSDIDPVVSAAMLVGLADPMVYMAAADSRDTRTIRDSITETFLRGVCA